MPVNGKGSGGRHALGDAHDLTALHEFIHRVCDDHGPLRPGVGEYVLGLAYDVRKAKEGARLRRQVADPAGGKTAVYGVEVVWVPLLLQAAILRGAAVGEALAEGFGAVEAGLIPGAANRLRGVDWEGATARADTRAAYFLPGNGKAFRKRSLLPVLRSLDGMHERLHEMGLAVPGPRAIAPGEFQALVGAEDQILGAAGL